MSGDDLHHVRDDSMSAPGAGAPAAKPPSMLLGVACGAGAALCWAVGFVAARHGIDIGFTPAELALHRFMWSGVAFLPLIARWSWAEFRWERGIVLSFFGGPPLALISYAGFLAVPLAHGGLIQPSCAAIGGLALATLVLKEKLPAGRVIGAAIIVAGLAVIGGEAVSTIGAHGLLGDLAFATAGLFFATFSTLLRLWRTQPMRAAAIVSVISLIDVPVHWLLFGFDHLAGFGAWENLLQAVVQGILAGPAAIYLFARAVIILGAGRGAVFPSLVPPFTLLIGFVALGAVPSLAQLAGLVIVIVGFRLTQRA
jgi:drug/metabolite transporter (DMT)-like permease